MVNKRNLAQHWPVIVLALIVVVIFGAVLLAFEVQQTQYAIVKTFGKAKRAADGSVKVYEPGLHFKLPYPIEDVWYHDNRYQCYDLSTGRVEQLQTRDKYQVIVSTFAVWRVGDPGTFFRKLGSTEAAEKNLDEIIRNSRSIVMGQHDLSELVNTDAGKVRTAEIEKEILDRCKGLAMDEYGIEIKHLGFRHLGFPEAVSEKVFERMVAERQRLSQKYISEGESEAQGIRAAADREASDILSQARAEAEAIRAEGDEEAATYYRVFRENPELAAFLRKLESLRTTLASDKTTLVLDTNTPPYDLLQKGATDLGKAGAGAAADGEK